MVVDKFDDEIVWVEHKVEEAWELAKTWVAKLKANKVEWEWKHLEDEEKCHKIKEHKEAEQACLDKEEAAAKMHANKMQKQQEVRFTIFFFLLVRSWLW